MPATPLEIAAVRRFTRFYTRQIGLLNDGLLKSPYTLTESRVLYEIASRDDVAASDLTRDLGLDAGFLSRTLRSLEVRGLIARTPSPTDGRRQNLTLTDAGRSAFAELDTASAAQVGAMLDALTDTGRTRLLQAMRTIEGALGSRDLPDEPIILRPHRPGDMGWVVHRHGALYAQEYGWDETFEPLVADVVAAFIRNFDAKRERCWIAERGAEILGSIFLVKQDDETAKLRLLYVEPHTRGTGLGRRLVAECLAFARSAGYARVVLWTNDCLHAAVKIYRDEGFRLIGEEKHHSFGKDLVGQTWELTL